MDSKVRQWIEQQHQKMKYSNTLSHEGFFVLLMYSLADFGKPITDEKLAKKLQHVEPDIGLDTSKHYGGDASLFELGCYLHVYIDRWLLAHRPRLRNGISSTYIKEFIHLFSSVFETDIYDLFYQRIQKYGELVRNGEFAPKDEAMNNLSDLTELILRSRDNAPPINYNFGNESPNLSFEAIGVKMRLVLWIKNVLPAILESLEKYCDMVNMQN